MSDAPEAAIEETPESLNEDSFADIARQRMAEVFGTGGPVEETPDEPDAPVEAEGTTAGPEVKVDESGRAHDPATGKFVAKPKPDDPAAGADDTVDTSAAEAKYQTPEEAYKAATEAQQLLGRQAQELGQTRAEIEAMRAEMAALKAGVDARLTVPPAELAALIEDDPRKAAHVAAAQGDPDAMEQALRAWAAVGAEETYEALAFRDQIMYEYREYARAQQAAAQPPVAPANGTAPTEDLAPVAAVIEARASDIEALMPAIGEEIKAQPLLKQALQYGTPEQKADALALAYDRAKSRHHADTSTAAITEATARAAEEAQQARADAAVVSASQGSASSADQPTFADELRQRFENVAVMQGHMPRPAA